MHAVASGLLARIKAFWPMLAGIVCARTALVVACYGSYASTDDGLFTDGAMLACCLGFLVVLAIVAGRRSQLSSRFVQLLFVLSVAAGAICSVALAAFDPADQALLSEGFALSVVSTAALSLCLFYWLRAVRTADEVTAALFVFSAFALSELLVYALGFAPVQVRNILGAVLIVTQLVFMGPATLHADSLTSRHHRRARTFFTFARSSMQDMRFLVACAVGIGCLAFVDGFLRGYPDGLPIPFTPGTRAAYVACTVAVCVLLMVLTVRRRERVMTVGIFLTMELLASAALVLFGAFPFQWEIGAVAVNTLNAIMCAYCFYMIIAFSHFGDRDSYVYALIGWVVCFGARSVARMLLFWVYPLTGNDFFINSLLGALILISTQVALVQFLLAEHREGSAESDRREAEADELLQQAQAKADQLLQQAQADVAQSEEALAQAQEALQNATQNAAEREAAKVAEAVAAVQQAAFEAISAAQAERCVKCTDGCSPTTVAQLTTARPPIEALPTLSSTNRSNAGGAPAAEPSVLVPHILGASSAKIVLSAQGDANTSLSTQDFTVEGPSSASTGAALTMEQLSESMRQRVQAMGEQFLLSDREVDVLTLYALGHTQKKVAEELFITPSTAHTHIKRIYSKCGMHSREEILEYLASYES